MSISWVAGVVRARALVLRRLGRAGARDLARCTSLDEALTRLAGTPYGRDVRPGQSLALAQHAVGATLLWHLRVLAGWLPQDGAEAVRLLCAGFEIANLDEHLHRIRGEGADPAYELGSLDTAWTRLAATRSVDEVRTVLGTSVWGDPVEGTPWAVAMSIRLAWARRVRSRLPEVESWATTAAALLVVRSVVLEGRGLTQPLAERVQAVLGSPFTARVQQPDADLETLRACLPLPSRWVFTDAQDTADLWRAEAGWWGHLEQDGLDLLRRRGHGRAAVLGAVAVLAADAWRVRAALEAAARGGSSAPRMTELFDVVG